MVQVIAPFLQTKIGFGFLNVIFLQGTMTVITLKRSLAQCFPTDEQQNQPLTKHNY